MKFSDDQYPASLKGGGPLLAAIRGVEGLLKPAFPENLFSYRYAQPRMTADRWAELANKAPLVGIAFAGWAPSREAGLHFRGDVMLALFLLTKQHRPEDLLLGTDTMPGVVGLTNVAVQYLHGKRIDGVGGVQVRSVSNQEAAGWVNDRTAIAALGVAVTNVGYSPDQLTADMADFRSLSGQWTFGSYATPDTDMIGESKQ